MSLTSHLRSPSSPVRTYLERAFPILQHWKRGSPNAKEFSAILGFDALPQCSLPTLAPTSHQGTIGTAVDYRLRYYFHAYDANETVAGRGVRMIGGKAQIVGRKFLDYQNNLVTRLSPVGRPLSSKAETALNTSCIVLAWFEQVIRCGMFSPESSLYLYKAKTVEDLFFMVQPDVIRDLGQLSSAFASDAKELFGGDAILNPTFRGSADIGGADADIIVGNTLVDFKCISKLDAAKLRDAALQLLGYMLLDYDDKYAVSDLLTYLPRHRFAWRMPLWKFVLAPEVVLGLLKRKNTPGKGVVDEQLHKRRREFRKIVQTAGANAQK